MPLKVLVAPDKFKGTLTASEAAAAIARGWQKARPEDQIELLPMSDGGDGFGEVMSGLLGAKPKTISTENAAHRPCDGTWWWEPETKTALIESANVIGLALLPPGRFHPFELDTFGLGAVLQAAARSGARRCLTGIGGSATNDGGFGLARALGWNFLDRHGNSIERWTELHCLTEIEPSGTALRFDELIVAVDVRNPLLGARGATRVYGPQKGLKASELAQAEKSLRTLAQIAQSDSNSGAAKFEGAGAAGGLVIGLITFLGGRLQPGFDLFARLANLDRRLKSADLVITGEGCLDRSTLMGKGVGQLASACKKLGVPCIALVGAVAEKRSLNQLFQACHPLTSFGKSETVQAKASVFLERAAELAAREPKHSAKA